MTSAPKRIDWSDVDWTKSTRRIAREKGVSQAAVCHAKKARGITITSRTPIYARVSQWFDENPDSWMLMSDETIASESRSCWSVVRKVRRSRRLVRRFRCVSVLPWPMLDWRLSMTSLMSAWGDGATVEDNRNLYQCIYSARRRWSRCSDQPPHTPSLLQQKTLAAWWRSLLARTAATIKTDHVRQRLLETIATLNAKGLTHEVRQHQPGGGQCNPDTSREGAAH